MTSQPTPAAVEAVALVLMEQRFGEPTSPVAHSIDRGDARAVLRFLLNNPEHLAAAQEAGRATIEVAPDGDEESTLWLHWDGEDPQPIVRRCDLSPVGQSVWPILVGRCTGPLGGTA